MKPLYRVMETFDGQPYELRGLFDNRHMARTFQLYLEGKCQKPFVRHIVEMVEADDNDMQELFTWHLSDESDWSQMVYQVYSYEDLDIYGVFPWMKDADMFCDMYIKKLHRSTYLAGEWIESYLVCR